MTYLVRGTGLLGLVACHAATDMQNPAPRAVPSEAQALGDGHVSEEAAEDDASAHEADSGPHNGGNATQASLCAPPPRCESMVDPTDARCPVRQPSKGEACDVAGATCYYCIGGDAASARAFRCSDRFLTWASMLPCPES